MVSRTIYSILSIPRPFKEVVWGLGKLVEISVCELMLIRHPWRCLSVCREDNVGFFYPSLPPLVLSHFCLHCAGLCVIYDILFPPFFSLSLSLSHTHTQHQLPLQLPLFSPTQYLLVWCGGEIAAASYCQANINKTCQGMGALYSAGYLRAVTALQI